MNDLRITIMGLGYIGLPTAALIASKGFTVIGVDVKHDVIDKIKRGKIHSVEPDLSGLLKSVVENKSLIVTDKAEATDVYIIAVHTPFKGNDFEPDLSYVESAVNTIIPALRPDVLVILESTSPVGTTEKLSELIYQKRPELRNSIFIAYCPERVLPGRILYELENNDRSIGGLDPASTEKAVQFYSYFVKGTLYKTNARTAEMCKLIENSFRDVNLAFANEVSMICESAGVNPVELINLANKHPRVKILQPGAGVGGHCIPVDPWFIVHDYNKETRLIKCARKVNNSKPKWVCKKTLKIIDQYEKINKKKPVVACMGLSYKPDVDDLRESPSLEIIKHLLREGVRTLVVEPNILDHPEFALTDYKEAYEKADIFLMLVAHKEFKHLDYTKKVLIDICGIRERRRGN